MKDMNTDMLYLRVVILCVHRALLSLYMCVRNSLLHLYMQPVARAGCTEHGRLLCKPASVHPRLSASRAGTYVQMMLNETLRPAWNPKPPPISRLMFLLLCHPIMYVYHPSDILIDRLIWLVGVDPRKACYLSIESVIVVATLHSPRSGRDRDHVLPQASVVKTIV